MHCNALFSLPFKSLFKAQMSQTAGSRVYVSLNVKQSCHCLLRQLGPFLPAALRGLRGRCSASQDQFESDLRGLTVSRKSCCLGVGTWTEPFCTGAAAGLIQHSKNSLWMLYACHPFTRASPAGPCWWLAHSLNCEPKNRGWYCTFQKDVLSKEWKSFRKATKHLSDHCSREKNIWHSASPHLHADGWELSPVAASKGHRRHGWKTSCSSSSSWKGRGLQGVWRRRRDTLPRKVWWGRGWAHTS